ncbi:hypothetical protein [Oceaniferula spumae]
MNSISGLSSIVRWLNVFMYAALMLTGSVVTAQVDEKDAIARASEPFVVPPRPINHVLDQARWLNGEEREKIQEELSRRFIEQQVDTYLVILKDTPPQGTQAFAQQVGAVWSRAPVWCVVMIVPADAAGVHVAGSGVEIPQPTIEKALADALKRAKRENTPKERALAACTECADDLRYVYAANLRKTERNVEARDKMIVGKTQKIKKLKLLAIAAGILMIIGVAALIFIIRKLKRRRASFTFPDTVWRERFLGPHSGGSGIVVGFQRQDTE